MSNQPTANNVSSSSSAPAPNEGDSSSTQVQNSSPQGPAPGLYAPSLTNDNFPDDSIPGIVARLMNPPVWLYNTEDHTYTFTINWVVGVAGPERFERLPFQERYVLRREDELRERGKEVGLSAEIIDWLKGGEETLTLPANHFE
ncbi:hypothetical protein DE146DRAFT_754350 [Phaeosphaeria sp. MPI-PUGE-AT-0046c]|nr:hypothetical protein DE146DRAFT_754350 [Phaeosphaeria sp. MPI-PUGE-AT-0046c]